MCLRYTIKEGTTIWDILERRSLQYELVSSALKEEAHKQLQPTFSIFGCFSIKTDCLAPATDFIVQAPNCLDFWLYNAVYLHFESVEGHRLVT
jgi:hypothetical protein